MKKIFTLIFALMGMAGVANAETVDDIAVCKHSYVLKVEKFIDGAKPGKGKLFGDGYFLDVTGGSIGTKGSVDLADETFCEGKYIKYAEYGKNSATWRLKNGQDVIAMRITAGSKIIILGEKHASRGPKITDTAPSGNNMQGTVLATSTNTSETGGAFEWTADDDRLIYIGSDGGDYYISYVIIEANEAEGTPLISVSDQQYVDGLWFREVTCKPGQAYGMDTEVYYTTNGDAPTSENGTLYTEPFKCYTNQMVKFQAYFMGSPIDGADNEAPISFTFNAPAINVDGANVTITSEYEGAKNYVTLDGNMESAEEQSEFTLDESATVTAFSTIQNGTYALFVTKSVSQDVYVLNPIKEQKKITVSGDVVLDEEATAEAKKADAAAKDVYKVENGAITADKKDFFVKGTEYGIIHLEDAQYQIDGQEVYLKMTDKTNITFQVAEGDSVDVVVVCSKNSCKTLNPENEEGVTTDRKCYVNLSGKTFGSDDITATHEFNGAEEGNNVIRFGLSAGTYTFQKYSGTGNIYVASIEITPAEKKEGLLGDVNGDGKVDVEDVVGIVNKILGEPAEGFIEANADVNGDSKIDVDDVVAAVNIILGDTNE